MTLHHLRVFIKVAECGSVSAAARECHLAQPTVSQLIKELEDFYAARLFERLSKRLYITEEGRRLLSRAKEVVNDSWMTSAPRSMSMGRGRPSKSTRPQSHSLKVKI